MSNLIYDYGHASYTLYFKTIYPDFQSFEEDENFTRLSNKLKTLYPDKNASDIRLLCQESYTLLIRHYRNTEIAFHNIDDFRDLFWEKIEQVYPNYCIRNDYYNRILSLPEKDLLAISTEISNNIDYTNEEVTDPLDEPLTHITAQNSGRRFGSKAERFRQQLYTAQYQLIDDFIKKFKKLFIQLGTSSNYVC